MKNFNPIVTNAYTYCRKHTGYVIPYLNIFDLFIHKYDEKTCFKNVNVSRWLCWGTQR